MQGLRCEKAQLDGELTREDESVTFFMVFLFIFVFVDCSL